MCVCVFVFGKKTIKNSSIEEEGLASDFDVGRSMEDSRTNMAQVISLSDSGLKLNILSQKHVL